MYTNNYDKNDREIYLKTVNNNGNALEFMQKYSDYEEIVLAAVRNNPYSFRAVRILNASLLLTYL